MLPYSKQTLDSDDIRAVVDALESDWLTTGPGIEQFESAFAARTESSHAIAVNSGTAALHCAMVAAGISAGDEVIVPALTFVATANAAVYCDANPVFADVDPQTLLIDPADVRAKITPKTKAIVAMDYAGQPCDYRALREIADQSGLVLIANACHSLGATYGDQPVGSLADLNCFSLHPAKQITTGEGGIVTTDDAAMAGLMRSFRNHGIDADHHSRTKEKTFRYSMQMLGFNYRLTDFQCALGMSQLKKLNTFTNRRRKAAQLYNSLLVANPAVSPLLDRRQGNHARHLYVVRWDREMSGMSRDEAFSQLRKWGIGVNVHYQPVYQHPFYQRKFGAVDHVCPNADAAYEQIISLPVFPSITEKDIRRVVEELQQLSEMNSRIGSGRAA